MSQPFHLELPSPYTEKFFSTEYIQRDANKDHLSCDMKGEGEGAICWGKGNQQKRAGEGSVEEDTNKDKDKQVLKCHIEDNYFVS